MAEATDGPDTVVDRANELYWSGDGTVEEILDEMGISRTTLYTSIEPIPSKVTCEDCQERMVFPNRTARDRGVAICPRCGRESAPGAVAATRGRARPAPRLRVGEMEEVVGRVMATLREVPPQRMAMVLGGAALGVVIGALAAASTRKD